MTIQTTRPARGLYADVLPADVRANAAEQRTRINWDAPYQITDDLRITTPILEYVMSDKTRAHLASMPADVRERYEREWAEGEAEVAIGDPISAEIKARAAAEWDSSDFIGEARRGA